SPATASVDENTILAWLGEAQSSVETVSAGEVSRGDDAMMAILRECVTWAARHAGTPQSDTMRARVLEVYGSLRPDSPHRHLLLLMLGHARGPRDLAELVECLVLDPPLDRGTAVLPLAPLLSVPPDDPALVFPRLLAGLGHPQIAAGILDLANHWTRHGIVDSHPARNRVSDLIKLLDGVTSHLESMIASASLAKPSVQTQCAQSISLAISLCDALAQIGIDRARPALERIASLPHRRLRVEAEAALARLGDPDAPARLVALAAEPSVRLFVLAYAEELGVLERVPESLQEPVARAEADLAMWLAQPHQMGFPPSSIELIHQCTLQWPGYDEPRMCFLLRYTYATAHAAGDEPAESTSLSNVGIAGPITRAFHADLANLPPKDLYAVFAGSDASHQEIQDQWLDLKGDCAAEVRPQALEPLVRQLRQFGCVEIRPRILTDFLEPKC
ncbi:MAG TPA: HEAT repeat domain-containing protein, partial [Pirellulaceae bacterium]